jgi:hypothetical protein
VEEESLLEISPLHDVLEPPAELEEIPPESTGIPPISEECPEAALSTETDLLVGDSRPVDPESVKESGPTTQPYDNVPASTEHLTESSEVSDDTRATSVEGDIAETGTVVSSDMSPEVTENVQKRNTASHDGFAEQEEPSLTLHEPVYATTDDPQLDHLGDDLVDSTIGESITHATLDPIDEDSSEHLDTTLEAEDASVLLADINHHSLKPAEINEIPLSPVLDGAEELALSESLDDTRLVEIEEFPSKGAPQAASEDPGHTGDSTNDEFEGASTNPVTAKDNAEMAANCNDNISTPEIATAQTLDDFDQEISIDEGLCVENEGEMDGAIVDNSEFESSAAVIPIIEAAEDDSKGDLPANDLPGEPISAEQQVNDASIPETIVDESAKEPPVADISVEMPVEEHSGDERSLETTVSQGEVPEEEALDDIEDAPVVIETLNMDSLVHDDPNIQPVVQDDVPIGEIEDSSRDAVVDIPIEAIEVTEAKSVKEEPLESTPIDDDTVGEESTRDHPEEPVASVETSVEESVIDYSNIEERDVDEPHLIEEVNEIASIEPPDIDLLDEPSPVEDTAMKDVTPVDGDTAEALPVAQEFVASTMEPLPMEEVEDIASAVQASEPQISDDSPLENVVLEEHVEEEVVPSVNDSEVEDPGPQSGLELETALPDPKPTEEDVPEVHGELDISPEAESGVDPVFNPVEIAHVEIEPVEDPQDFTENDTTFDETPIGDIVDAETIVEQHLLDVPPLDEEQSAIVDQNEEQSQTIPEEPLSAQFVKEESEIPSADVVDDIPFEKEVEPSIGEDNFSHREAEETTEESIVSEVPNQGETDLAIEHAEVPPTEENFAVQDELSVGEIDDSTIETHETTLAYVALATIEEPVLAELTFAPVAADDDVVEGGETITDRSVEVQDSGKAV